MTLLDIIVGRRLANREQSEQKIGWIAGVPAMGLDGLGSSSYGPEAGLTILMPLGAASLAWIGWVIAPIVALLAILYFSYRQTIVAYPGSASLDQFPPAMNASTASCARSSVVCSGGCLQK